MTNPPHNRKALPVKKNDRVALASTPQLVGSINSGADKRGLYEVAFDGGGSGWFRADQLIPADQATTTKTWPPAGLETKVAGAP
jgi:hypothetical protein